MHVLLIARIASLGKRWLTIWLLVLLAIYDVKFRIK